MSWFNNFASIISEGWVITLLHSLWIGALSAGLVYLFLWLFQVTTPRHRYLAGLAGMGLFIVGIFITLGVVTPWQSAPSNQLTVQEPVTLTQFLASEIEATKEPEQLLSIIKAYMPVILKIWFAGVMLLFFRIVGGYQYLRKLVKLSDDTVPEAWKEMIYRLSKRLELSREVLISHSKHIDMPMVFGHAKPVLLLPVGLLTGMSPQQLEAIFAHELAHIRRHDYLVNIGQQVLEAFFFFNPFIWLLSGFLRNEREKCCDDLAMEICQNHREYAEALSTLETYRVENLRGAVALLGTKGALFNRVRRLIDPSYGDTGSSRWVLMIILSASFFLFSYFTRHEAKISEKTEAVAEATMASFTQGVADTVPPPAPEEAAEPEAVSIIGYGEAPGVMEIEDVRAFSKADIRKMSETLSAIGYFNPEMSKEEIRKISKSLSGIGYINSDTNRYFSFTMPDVPGVKVYTSFDTFEFPEFEVSTFFPDTNSFVYVYRNDTLPGSIYYNDSILSEEDREALRMAREEMHKAREKMQEERERMREIMHKYREEQHMHREELQRAMRLQQSELLRMQRNLNGVVIERLPSKEQMRELERALRESQEDGELTEAEIERIQEEVERAMEKADEAMEQATRQQLRIHRLDVPKRPYMDHGSMEEFEKEVVDLLIEDGYLKKGEKPESIELRENSFKYNNKEVKSKDLQKYLKTYENYFGEIDGNVHFRLEH